MTTPENLSLRAQLAIEKGDNARLRSAITLARNVLLRHEHSNPRPDYPLSVLHILSRALEPLPLRAKHAQELCR